MRNRQTKLLIVAEDYHDINVLKSLIDKKLPQAQILTANSGEAGIAIAKSSDSDVIILDIAKPESVCRKLKQDEFLKDTPVVFVTTLKQDKENRMFALEAGAEGFLNKPIDESELVAQILAMIKIKYSHTKERNTNKRLAELVEQKTIELRKELAERNKAEVQIIKNKVRLEGLLSILQYDAKNIQDFLDNALNEAIRLTESKIGYIYFYSEDKKEFTLNTWSNAVMNECKVVNPQTKYNLDKTGIWGEAVRQRKHILINDFEADNPLKKGIPAGHVKLNKFLTVPLFQDKSIVAVVGVANKENNYDESDVLQLNLLMDAVWKTTSRAQAELNLKASEARLRQSEKMEAIGQLAGGIAHDFNNVLGGIVGYTEMSLSIVEKGSVLERNLEQILKASNRAKNLVKQILTFSRQSSTQKSITNIRLLAYEVLELLRAVVPSSIIMDINLCMETKPVLADPTQIHEILINLINNAVYAMAGKGILKVNIKTENIVNTISGRSKEISPGEYTVIEVSDSGCGMDSQTIEKAFNPFFTTKPVGEGTGMGLSVVLGVVHAHNGEIQVDSKLNGGTTFRIYLPVAPMADVESNIKTDQKQIRGGNETILFIDDENVLVELFKEMLEGIGYKVIGMSSSVDALKYFQLNHNDINLIITDQTMPILTGTDFAQEAKKIRNDIPVILCSGYSKVLYQDNGGPMSCDKILVKPVPFIDFAVAIRELLDR